MITIEIFYITSSQKICLSLLVQEGTTVGQALKISNIQALIPNIDELKIGIFGQFCSKSTTLKDKDRVEIYTPLKIDPMERRRIRASEISQSS